jgi:hypothetical protein
MTTLNILVLRFCLWQMGLEHTIGESTGMNPRYLASLRNSMRDMRRDLRLMELNHVRH